MLISRIHPITGETNTLDLDVSERQLERIKTELIQDVLQHLTADEREFILSGLLPGEFDALYGEESGPDYDDDEGPAF